MIKINNRREEYSILDTFFNVTNTISELLLGLDYDKSEEHLFSAFRSKVMEIYAKNVDLSIPVTATYILSIHHSSSEFKPKTFLISVEIYFLLRQLYQH